MDEEGSEERMKCFEGITRNILLFRGSPPSFDALSSFPFVWLCDFDVAPVLVVLEEEGGGRRDFGAITTSVSVPRSTTPFPLFPGVTLTTTINQPLSPTKKKIRTYEF